MAEDPCRDMVVNYHSKSEAAGQVLFDTDSRHGDPKAYRFRVRPDAARTIPGLPHARWIHSAALKGLEPDHTYYFVVGSESIGFSDERKFRTTPDGDGIIRFVAGGDVDVRGLGRRMLRVAAERDPMFAVIGGDLAYANGELDNLRKWDRWFDNWSRYMVTPTGCSIPIVAAIGNHEVNSDIESNDPKLRAPFFTTFFASQSESTYFSRRFGDTMALIVLDSDHLVPHADQVEWLEGELERYADLPAQIAVYHVPLYPAHREFEYEKSRIGRESWGPLFDEYGLTAAFEHHDHVFKRTQPLRNGAIDSQGTVYLGDGAMGRSIRSIERPFRWYVAHAASRAHIWDVVVTPNHVTCKAVNRFGRVFDECEIALDTNVAIPDGHGR